MNKEKEKFQTVLHATKIKPNNVMEETGVLLHCGNNSQYNTEYFNKDLNGKKKGLKTEEFYMEAFWNIPDFGG